MSSKRFDPEWEAKWGPWLGVLAGLLAPFVILINIPRTLPHFIKEEMKRR